MGLATSLSDPLTLPSLTLPAPYPPAHTSDTTSTAVLDQRVIDVRSIRQQSISKRTLVFITAIGLEGNLLPIDQLKCGVFGLLAKSLAFLGAVDAAEADAFRTLVVKDFDGVAVNYPDYSSGEVGS